MEKKVDVRTGNRKAIDAGENHKVASEISDQNGAWSETALEFGGEIEKSIAATMLKYEGQLSVDAMQMIMINAMWQTAAFAKALSAFKEPAQ